MEFLEIRRQTSRDYDYAQYATKFSDSVQKVILSASTNTQFTVPADAKMVTIAADDTIFVALNEDAVVPTGTVATSAGEMNPGTRVVEEGDVINIISLGTPNVSLQFWK